MDVLGRARAFLLSPAHGTFILLMFWGVMGCVPMTSAPPAVPIPQAYGHEFGGALQGGTGVHHGVSEPLTNLQMWYRDRTNFTDEQETGAIMQVGFPAGVSAGGYWRGKFELESENVAMGPQVEGGWLWFGAGLPMAFRVGENHWVTTQPSFRLSMFSLIHVPVGYSWQVSQDLRLDLETGVHALALSYKQELQDPVHVYGSLGLSSQW